jgi:F-type H+-transporting ATPase subunit epsilon
MAGTFKFELVSPERVLFSEDAEQVVVPGIEGDFAVLSGHAPVISTLRPGVLDVTLPSGKRRIFVKGGFAEVDPERLTILAQNALDVEKVDANTVAAELSIAQEELSAAKDDQARMAAEAVIHHLQQIRS